ncbi:MAG: HAD family hydrolase [Gemmatimonadales bacterium]
MTRLPRAVLLDLDDTILDDSGHSRRCWSEACLRHAADLEGIDPSVLHEAIERVRTWYWSDAERHRIGRLNLLAAYAEVVAMACEEVGLGRSSAAADIAAHYHAERNAAIAPFPDAVETVRWLRERGCRLALLTNGADAPQRSKIERFGLAPLFDLILIEGELGFGKPDPRVYRRALADLDVAPGEAWMVGDNPEWDVAAPQREGIFGVWVDRWERGLAEGHPVRPDRIIRRLVELRGAGAEATAGA